MAAKRKAVPRTEISSSNPTNEPADPQLTRYNLSDNYSASTDNPADRLLPEQREQTQPISLSDPFQDVASSVGEHSSVDSYQYSQPSTLDYVPYQPGQHLAPIITGETLQLDPDSALQSTTHSDSFYSPATSLSSGANALPFLPNQYYQAQEYHPPSNQSYTSSYDQLTLPAGSEIDHFNYDTEAYASGNYSRASYRPPRSRSPTPAVDDEDYMIVGNESVHYTGYPDDHSDNDNDATEKPYYTERGCLPNGQNVLYDPEPETPTSTVYSLPPDEKTRHFGPAPTGRVLRRHKTKRRVQLTNGNLVVDLDVPPKLVLPRRGEPETMKTRYTAVTCDPDDFEKKGFFLRQNESGRRTELFIVITMYNVSFFYLFM
jgi:chitin synthase